MQIFLASQSQIKLNALQSVLASFAGGDAPHTIHTVVTNSQVPETPQNSQSYIGALARATNARVIAANDSAICIGLESGLCEREGFLFEECWCVVLAPGGQKYVGYSSGIELPADIVRKLRAGEEHVDIINNHVARSKGSHKDTWAVYTKNLISRETCLYEATRNAWVNYLNILQKDIATLDNI